MSPIRIEMPKEMFTPSEFRSYAEHADVGKIVVGGVAFSFPDGVDWAADVTNTGGALLVSGSVSGQATTECARCLEQASFEVSGEIEGYFLISSEDAVPDDMEEDEFDRLGEDKTIDMAPLIQAALVLEVPQVPLCSDDCAGLCPKCGANLNEGACSCENDDDSLPANPFAVLKDFDFGS